MKKITIFVYKMTLLEKTIQMLPERGEEVSSSVGAGLDKLLDSAKNSDESIDDISHFSRNPSVIWTN